jgi:leader peptidase (prepilin peptidase)/N-methyltransferase
MLQTLAVFAIPPRDLPMSLALFSVAVAFSFGALWGSFLNVVIARVPLRESVVTPRSRCPSCKAPIGARDNVPIASWLWLRGKCRRCRASISPRYPFVELLGALAAAGSVARFGWSFAALELFVFILVLIAISFIDLDWFLVPDSLNVALAASGLLGGTLRAWLVGPQAFGGLSWQSVGDRVIGGVGAALLLGATIYVSTATIRVLQERYQAWAKVRRGVPVARRRRRPRWLRRFSFLRLPPGEWAMGWGDPLIFAGIGLHVGWQLLPVVLLTATLVGSVVGLVIVALGGLKNRAPVQLPGEEPWTPPDHGVPFGPFLAVGGLTAAFFGDVLVAGFENAIGAVVDLLLAGPMT